MAPSPVPCWRWSSAPRRPYAGRLDHRQPVDQPVAAGRHQFAPDLGAECAGHGHCGGCHQHHGASQRCARPGRGGAAAGRRTPVAAAAIAAGAAHAVQHAGQSARAHRPQHRARAISHGSDRQITAQRVLQEISHRFVDARRRPKFLIMDLASGMLPRSMVWNLI